MLVLVLGMALVLVVVVVLGPRQTGPGPAINKHADGARSGRRQRQCQDTAERGKVTITEPPPTVRPPGHPQVPSKLHGSRYCAASYSSA